MPDASVPSPFWLSAFLDLPSVQFSPGVEFWSAVPGYSRSPARGGSGECVTLLPAQGDSYLHVQRLESGAARIHRDGHVADPEAAAVAAVGTGATVVARPDPGCVVLAPPGGLVFCFVSHQASARPEPTSWPGVGWSLVGQVCLDIPPKAYDVECAFWAGVLGGTGSPSISTSARPTGPPRWPGTLWRPFRLMTPDRWRWPGSAHAAVGPSAWSLPIPTGQDTSTRSGACWWRRWATVSWPCVTLTVREPGWEQHRLVTWPDPSANVHVFSPSALDEPRPHVAVTDRLAHHPDDLAAYAEIKRRLSARGLQDRCSTTTPRRGWSTTSTNRSSPPIPSTRTSPEHVRTRVQGT